MTRACALSPQAELEYRLKMLTPSGGSFIPPVQQELVSYLAMAPFRKVEARAVGSMLVVATQDVEMMDRVIVAMISVISHAMIVATQVRPSSSSSPCARARVRVNSVDGACVSDADGSLARGLARPTD